MKELKISNEMTNDSIKKKYISQSKTAFEKFAIGKSNKTNESMVSK